MKENKLEGHLTWLRSSELELDPVRGNFDVAHLKEIHRRLFQDLPKAGLWKYDVQPGEFRQEAETWCKKRVLENIPGDDGNPDVSFTLYSKMDRDAIRKLDSILKEAKPEKLKGLDRKDFIKKISDLYSDIDYIHPFREGNSRTLRVFTEQFASGKGRDLLYIARDRGLAARASLDDGQNMDAMARAVYDMGRYRQYSSLPQLLDKTVEVEQAQSGPLLVPGRRRLPPLAVGVQAAVTERACAAKTEADGLTEQQRAIVMARVRQNIAKGTARGDVPSIQIREEQQTPTKNRGPER